MSSKIMAIETTRMIVRVGKPFRTPFMRVEDSAVNVRAIHRGGNFGERGLFIVELMNGYMIEIVEKDSYMVYWKTS